MKNIREYHRKSKMSKRKSEDAAEAIPKRVRFNPDSFSAKHFRCLCQPTCDFESNSRNKLMHHLRTREVFLVRQIMATNLMQFHQRLTENQPKSRYILENCI